LASLTVISKLDMPFQCLYDWVGPAENVTTEPAFNRHSDVGQAMRGARRVAEKGLPYAVLGLTRARAPKE